MPTTAALRNPWLSSLFGHSLPDCLELLDRAVSDGSLGTSAVYTIHDLLVLSGRYDESVVAFLILLFSALSDGSTCLKIEPMSLAPRLAALGYADADGLATAIAATCNQEECPELIGRPGDISRPVSILETADGNFAYFQKHLRHEEVVWRRLLDRCASPSLPASPEAVLAVREVVRSGQAGRTLHPDQQRALALALLKSLVVISGGPGTGKTSIVGALLRCLVRTGIAPEEIALAAPTGRAAQRMTDAIRASLSGLSADEDERLAKWECRAVTLHQLLQYSPTSGRFHRHDENPLPCKVLIIDEASMVGLSLLSQVLLSLPSDGRLILLGDKDQLPSVEAGGWLGNLVAVDGMGGFSPEVVAGIKELLPELPAPAVSKTTKFAIAVLRENFRSEQRIRRLADEINRQDVGALSKLEEFPTAGWPALVAQGGCWRMDPGPDPRTLRQVLRTWGEHFFPAGYQTAAERCRLPSTFEVPESLTVQVEKLFDAVDRCRILTVVRDGPWGATGINATLASFLRGGTERGPLFPGAPVLILRNDYEREIHNGDVGVALPGIDGSLRVAFRKGAGFVSFALHALPASEIAFATTVHKSQGSEFDHVVLVMPPEGGRRLLTCELLYTGLTRAKKSVVLCGPLDAFAYAATNRSERESGIFLSLTQGAPAPA